MKLASSLLDYLAFLKKTLRSVSSDFSALYAISNWFLKALEKTPTPFIPLLREVKALHDVVSLSAGLGLFVLWTALYIDDTPSDIREMMFRTDLLSTSLIESADPYGNYSLYPGLVDPLTFL